MSNAKVGNPWTFTGKGSDELKFIDQIGSFSEKTSNNKMTMLENYIHSLDLRSDLPAETLNMIRRFALNAYELEQTYRGLK
jgi:hypothetical protein